MPSEWIRNLCLDAGFDLIGIVDPGEIGSRTTYKRVIVLAVVVPDESAEFTRKIEIDGRLRWSKWIYEALENGASKVAWKLMEMGISSEPLQFDDSWEKIDLKRAAVMGGLGVLGENNLVLNREWGPRLRFTAVFADIDEEIDRPLDIELCNMCTICIRECPTGALDATDFDRERCLAEFNPDDNMMRLQDENVEFVSEFTKKQCSICITSCPFGFFNKVKMLPGF